MSITKINAKQLAKKVFHKEPLFILDVRNEKNFHDWKIEGENFEHLNIPYFELLDGVEEILPDIPAKQEIVVVCAKEGSSIMVAELLAEHGLSVSYLEGGMKAWSEYMEPIKISDLKNGGRLYQFVRIGKGCLSYMVVSNGEAVIIDASRMTNVYLDFAKQEGVQITHVFDTHLHADHISGGRRIAQETGAKYWLPPEDATEVTFSFHSLKDGERIKIGDRVDIEAFYSPGHTIGSTSFIIDKTYLLSGDILFVDSIGRPDLAGLAEDWVEDLRETLYERYRSLPDKLVVLPAHFMTIKEFNEDGSVSKPLNTLFVTNHGLTVENHEEFRRLVTKNLPPQPHSFEEIRLTNMGKLNPGDLERSEMEVGPNLCSVR